MKNLIGIAAVAAGAALATAAAAQVATNSKAPIDVTADNLVTSNSGCEATWSGNAEALQDNARLRADVLKIFNKPSNKAAKSGQATTGCGDMDRLEAHGSVYYVTPGRRVRANDAVYQAGSTTIIMTGDVVAVTEDKNVLRGDKMVFNTETGEGQVIGGPKGPSGKGRPRGVFYPKSSDNPSSSDSGKPK